VKNIKKFLVAALAALMLAGALSAISSATSMSSLGPGPVVGEGASPFPAVLSSAPQNDTASVGNHF
jgi:hypothetical protein